MKEIEEQNKQLQEKIQEKIKELLKKKIKELEEQNKKLEEENKKLEEENKKLNTPPTCIECDRPASRNIWWEEDNSRRFWDLCDCCFEEECN